MREIKAIHQVAHHRNGVCGQSFYAVVFTPLRYGRVGKFVATVFPEQGHVAVLQISGLPNVTFGENSWRGDRFESELRAAIAKWEDSEQARYDAMNLQEEPSAL